MATRLRRSFFPVLSSPFASRRLSTGGGGAAEGVEDDAVVADVVSVLREQRCRSRWGFLRSLYGATGFTSEQATQITLGLRSNPRLALRFFRWSEASSLCRHDLSSYAAMVHVLARGRLRSAAVSLIHSAILLVSTGGGREEEDAPIEVLAALVKSYRACDATPLAFDLLVRACLQARRLEQAAEIVRKLRKRAIFPTVPTCNELIRTVSAARGATAGLAIYEELFGDGDGGGRPRGSLSPNVQTFNALLLAFNREGRSEDGGERIRRDMDRYACRPNCFTYSILMAGLCERGRVEAAKRLFQEMAAEGIKPDATAYNTMIGGLCRAGEMGGAKELFRAMTLEGIEPTSTSYEMLIAGHCTAGNVGGGGDLYEEMLRRGFRPEGSTAGRLIGALCEKGRVAEGLRLLRREMESGGGLFAPSREMFLSLIKGLCREGKVEEGLKLQAEMAGRGFQADSEIYRAFLDGYLQRGDALMAGKLSDEMLSRGLAPRREPGT